MDLIGKIFRISAHVFITRMSDEERPDHARHQPRNATIAKGFSRCCARKAVPAGAAPAAVDLPALGKICRPGY
ncbi:MAG: hypothetical protein E6501_28675 [Bradyrhizobium sp.]|jgi:hypothetical protein|nr:hypothetical protein [Bradyrhizobium sp.]MDU6672564.1 hypothetical protein [Bradyrhizobium sp.]MDU6729799.1 hypothetical protein [Bradyrhizobium sp.]